MRSKILLSVFVKSTLRSIAMTNINTLDATTTFSAESTNTPLKVQAGVGNGTVGVAIQLFSPKQVDVKSGESVTWYNPTPVPEPHTVTFVLDDKSYHS